MQYAFQGIKKSTSVFAIMIFLCIGWCKQYFGSCNTNQCMKTFDPHLSKQKKFATKLALKAVKNVGNQEYQDN